MQVRGDPSLETRNLGCAFGFKSICLLSPQKIAAELFDPRPPPGEPARFVAHGFYEGQNFSPPAMKRKPISVRMANRDWLIATATKLNLSPPAPALTKHRE